MNFIEKVKRLARENKRKVVLPETEDQRVIDAAHIILSEDIADIILLGDKDEILSKNPNLDLSKAEFINPKTYEKLDKMIDELVEIRKNKGMTKEDAAKLLQLPLYFGVMLVNSGLADGMVAGAINSTADVLRPSLQILKTAKNTKLVSGFFIMSVPDCSYGDNGIFIFADCGLNQDPNAEELANIAISSSESFKSLVGGEPVVAMLSHSSKGSAKHVLVDKVVEATKIAKELAPDLKLDGEFQLDSAIVPEIAAKKAPDSSVAGKANVLIFPNLDAANIGYKLVERLAKADAYGPVLQGIRKPVNDLSRGCNVNDIVGVVAITVLQAQKN